MSLIFGLCNLRIPPILSEQRRDVLQQKIWDVFTLFSEVDACAGRNDFLAPGVSADAGPDMSVTISPVLACLFLPCHLHKGFGDYFGWRPLGDVYWGAFLSQAALSVF